MNINKRNTSTNTDNEASTLTDAPDNRNNKIDLQFSETTLSNNYANNFTGKPIDQSEESDIIKNKEIISDVSLSDLYYSDSKN